MIKKLYSIVCATLVAGFISAQEAPHERAQRTPEEEASKQTIRLVRELGIRDSVRFDTIYRMHLKYARIRAQLGTMTRAQSMERMQSFYEDLKRILTPEEYERFMNHPVELPRRPHGANRMAPASAPSDATPNKPEERTQPR